MGRKQSRHPKRLGFCFRKQLQHLLITKCSSQHCDFRLFFCVTSQQIIRGETVPLTFNTHVSKHHLCLICIFSAGSGPRCFFFIQPQTWNMTLHCAGLHCFLRVFCQSVKSVVTPWCCGAAGCIPVLGQKPLTVYSQLQRYKVRRKKIIIIHSSHFYKIIQAYSKIYIHQCS